MKNARNLITIAFITLAALTSFVSTASADNSALCSPVHRANMLDVAHDYIDFYNSLGSAPYTDIYAEDVVLASTAGVFNGPGEIEAIMNAVLVAIPDLQYEIEEILVEGNKFTLRYSYSGTHLGDFMGVPASGNSLKVYGLEINTVENGKIVRTENFTDFFGLFVQMGAISL